NLIPVHLIGLEVELCKEFGSDFDKFWNQLKMENHDVLLAMRTTDTLRWHFRDKLDRQNVWILKITRGQCLVAYAIFDRLTNSLGMDCLRLVDFQALKGFEEVLPSVMVRILRKCREEKIHLLEVPGCWMNRSQHSKIVSPFCRKLRSWMFYYKVADKKGELAKALKDPRVWAPYGFDGDAVL